MASTRPQYVLLRDGTLLERVDDETYRVEHTPEKVDNLLRKIGLEVELIPPKTRINIMLDNMIVDFFKEFGARYQTRINAVLWSYVETHKKKK